MVVIIRLPRFLRCSTDISAILLASVPQEVNIISFSFAEIVLAIVCLAQVTTSSAFIPKICKEEGLPQSLVKALFIYSTAFLHGFVVALLSR